MKNSNVILMTVFILFNCSCKMNESSAKPFSLKSFFTNTSWIDFNLKTLEKNNLKHLANDKVDFFNRESFFLFMTDSKYDNFYDSVYLIEIEKKEGERNLSKKILLISYNKEVTLLAFKKAIKWEQVALSQNEVNRYTSSNLKKSTKVNEGEYFITTKIIGNKF